MGSHITDWMEEYGWERNPFNFRIYPDLMIGYSDEKQRIRNSIESDSKFILLLGDTGAGKTNLLRSVEEEYANELPLFYMSKPPVTEEDLLDYLKDEVLSPGIISRLFNSYSLYNIHENLNSKYGDRMILLMDEGHEASTEVLEWVRTAIDHIDGMTVVAAGLPSFEEKLEEDVGTLYSRATEVVNLDSLDKDHTVELVRKRIEQVGGSSLEPFTQSAVLRIYEETEGFPREVLRLCNECVVTAADEGKSIIDEEDVKTVVDESSHETNNKGGEGVEEEESEEEPDGGENTGERLTPKQQEIHDAVSELGEATSGDIVDHIGLDDYKSRSHAIRSINNILRRLMEQDVLSRDRRGRNYIYRVSEE
ncbi:MAG: BlaI/MecI/CopY family transcriptional regulator [Candidatus Nanohaloarchaea archaeon]|nr:BlaI/MecI/CopY family transcriptional regulator [Candidatus Nanohaloarchaea archaeon]